MNNEELKKKVNKAAQSILNKKNFIAPVDVLIVVGILSNKDYEDWRRGRVPFLERVCNINISKLSLVMKELRDFARKGNLRPSKTVYKKWGKGNKIFLQFSKSGSPKIEEAYSTHFVGLKKASENEAIS